MDESESDLYKNALRRIKKILDTKEGHDCVCFNVYNVISDLPLWVIRDLEIEDEDEDE